MSCGRTGGLIFPKNDVYSGSFMPALSANGKSYPALDNTVNVHFVNSFASVLFSAHDSGAFRVAWGTKYRPRMLRASTSTHAHSYSK